MKTHETVIMAVMTMPFERSALLAPTNKIAEERAAKHDNLDADGNFLVQDGNDSSADGAFLDEFQDLDAYGVNVDGAYFEGFDVDANGDGLDVDDDDLDANVEEERRSKPAKLYFLLGLSRGELQTAKRSNQRLPDPSLHSERESEKHNKDHVEGGLNPP